MPELLFSNGRRFEHVQTFKHDFFAATGLYRAADDGRLAVAKLGRRTRCFGFPMQWIGRVLGRREIRMYERFGGRAGVPRYVGPVDGVEGFLHEFVPGHPLADREPVSDDFFDQLAALLREIHADDTAYVDLNKRQNILMGDDARPYLIDFQISLRIPRRGLGRLWPARWLLTRFQQADWYHFLKHKRRLRPDLLTDAERATVERISVWIRLHRLVARPLTNLRRRIKARLKKTETMEVAGSSAK